MSEPQTTPIENADGPKGPSKSELKKQAKAAEKAKKAAEKAAKQQELEAQKAAAEPDFSMDFYGALPLNQSQTRTRRERVQLASLAGRHGETVLFRARIQTSRAQGSKMVFLNLRQGTESVQALAVVTPENISKQMVKWIAGLATESIVLVEGIVNKPPEPIKSATVSDAEVQVTQLHLISGIEGRLPFSLEDASRPDTETNDDEAQFNRVLLDTRLNNRVIDLRTQTNHAIFRLQAGISELFREYLHANRFTEIHSPKLQGAATESGASVFKVQYFKGNAYLAQSPQLAKQMAIAADFERVYEIGPVFRAENANTHRHMTEFVGLDLEMSIEEHYHEVLELLDGLFLHIFRGLRDRYTREIEAVRLQFPAEEFKWREGPEGTLRLTFKEAIDLLVEDGVPREELDDIDTTNEKRLGRIVRAKYETDYFIIDKFPLALRPFYTMPDPEDPTVSNSYDFFMRGEEILSGAQRIHDAQFLFKQHPTSLFVPKRPKTAGALMQKAVDPSLAMPIIERDATGDCPPELSNCQPAYITGSDPTQQEDGNPFGPINYGKPGPHRFIGIGMVAGLIFVALSCYLAFGRGPRRMFRKHCRCLGGRQDEEAVEQTSMKQVSVVLETKSSASYSDEEKPDGTRKSSNSIPVAQEAVDARSKSHRKRSSRSRSRSKHKKSGSRSVDGSMVHHAVAGSKDVDGELGNTVTGWEVDHRRGVRYEVRTPVDDQTDERLEVHLQKPALTYQR
ncbi:hypothetical protein NP233_g9937 [Leucocoprinus birnbaumii]|uniref:Aspartate--tRNA ligase, cytoplasmic n=1 Tax=Leucocoprinus birnbaumii TaxID=56174 RepID=A0AAD5YMN0_9AGAR|nr:hypothetical protein NP233_g9937 [Leucocoprinus birnbaumii]